MCVVVKVELLCFNISVREWIFFEFLEVFKYDLLFIRRESP